MVFRVVRSQKFVSAVLVGVTVMASFGLAHAAPKAATAFQPVRMMVALVERLDLTSSQRGDIRSILRGHRDEVTGLLAQEQQARKVLAGTIHAQSPNEADIRSASAAVSAVGADFAVERAKIYSEISAVLTAEQRTEIERFVGDARAAVLAHARETAGPRAGLDRLRLDEGQKVDIDAILAAHRADLETLGAAVVSAHQALGQAVRQQQFNEAAVREAARAVATASADLAVERAEISSEIHAVLTPEQQAKLADVRERLQDRAAARAQSALNLGLRLL